jgi:hypothetical protein
MDQALTDIGKVSRAPRIAYRVSAELTIHPVTPSKGKPLRCFTLLQDLSESGFRIVHAAQLFPGQQLEIELEGKSRRAAVVWCKRLPYEHYSIGCRFLEGN